MECLPGETVPEGDGWTYELKLDGYRVIAVKGSGKLTLCSRHGTDLTRRFGYVAEALASLPDETVIDGKVIALDEQGKPNFNLLQNYRSAESHIRLYAFDARSLIDLSDQSNRNKVFPWYEPIDVFLQLGDEEISMPLAISRIVVNWRCISRDSKEMGYEQIPC